jgi:hypothetical protein
MGSWERGFLGASGLISLTPMAYEGPDSGGRPVRWRRSPDESAPCPVELAQRPVEPVQNIQVRGTNLRKSPFLICQQSS